MGSSLLYFALTPLLSISENLREREVKKIVVKVRFMVFIATVAEWLRRLTRNQIPIGSAGSNPAGCGLFFLNEPTSPVVMRQLLADCVISTSISSVRLAEWSKA